MPKVTTPPCPRCKKTEVIDIPGLEYMALNENKVAIQRAAPSLTAAQRERFITGYCEPCYDEIFSFDEEDEDD